MVFLFKFLYTQNMFKKALLTLIASIFFAESLFAVNAYYFAPSYPGEKTRQGNIIDSNKNEAKSNGFPVGSVLEVTDKKSGRSVVVTVIDTLTSSALNSDIDLTSAALSELDSYGDGVLDVSLRLIWAPEEVAENEDSYTGWYEFRTNPYTNRKEAFTAYERLIRNGFKPRVEMENGEITIIIPYIREFDKEAQRRNIYLAGIDEVSLIETPSPLS